MLENMSLWIFPEEFGETLAGFPDMAWQGRHVGTAESAFSTPHKKPKF